MAAAMNSRSNAGYGYVGILVEFLSATSRLISGVI